MIIIVLNITVIVDLLIASTRPIMFTILTWKKLQSIIVFKQFARVIRLKKKTFANRFRFGHSTSGPEHCRDRR